MANPPPPQLPTLFMDAPLETKVGYNSDETAKNQPMEKIKKLSEETVRLNTMMSQMDLYLGNVSIFYNSFISEKTIFCMFKTIGNPPIGSKFVTCNVMYLGKDVLI